MLNVADFSNFDFGQIIEHMQAQGIVCEHIPNSDMVQVRYQNHVEYLVDHDLPNIPLGYKNIIEDKFFLKQLLMDVGIPVHPGDCFFPTELELALQYINEELHWPVVIKPTSLSCGDLVFCAIHDEHTFRNIWQENILQSNNGPFIVEKCWPSCPDYRFVIIPGHEPYVVKRSVPTVTGDGLHSIDKLVQIENINRSEPKRNSLCKIVMDDNDGLRCISDQGLTPSYIPTMEEDIKLRYATNLSYGGMSEIIDTSIVHSTYWPIFHKYWALFPQLPILSLDILSYDISLPASAKNMVVCESHITPGVGMFLAPGKGQGVDLYEHFIRIIFPELASSCK